MSGGKSNDDEFIFEASLILDKLFKRYFSNFEISFILFLILSNYSISFFKLFI